MSKPIFIIASILLMITSQLMIGQNKETNIDEEQEIMLLREQVFRTSMFGLKPFPSQEEEEIWNKRSSTGCGATWLSNFSDYYATESEDISIVLLNTIGYYNGYSIEEKEVEVNIPEREFRVKHAIFFDSVPPMCDGCVGGMGIERDTLYVGKLPKGDYSIIHEKSCNLMQAVKDTFHFTIYDSEPKEEVAKIKKQKIQEQIPENLPPRIRVNYNNKDIFIQYTLTEAEELSVEIHNLSNAGHFILKELSIQSQLGYNELYFAIPDELINRAINEEETENEEGKGNAFKVIVKIGGRAYESAHFYYWELKSSEK